MSRALRFCVNDTVNVDVGAFVALSFWDVSSSTSDTETIMLFPLGGDDDDCCDLDSINAIDDCNNERVAVATSWSDNVDDGSDKIIPVIQIMSRMTMGSRSRNATRSLWWCNKSITSFNSDDDVVVPNRGPRRSIATIVLVIDSWIWVSWFSDRSLPVLAFDDAWIVLMVSIMDTSSIGIVIISSSVACCGSVMDFVGVVASEPSIPFKSFHNSNVTSSNVKLLYLPVDMRRLSSWVKNNCPTTLIILHNRSDTVSRIIRMGGDTFVVVVVVIDLYHGNTNW